VYSNTYSASTSKPRSPEGLCPSGLPLIQRTSMTTDASIHAELDGLLLPWDDVSTRPMFGGRGYFVEDRLFAAFYDGIATKLPDQDREEVLNSPKPTPFTPTPGRRFGNWVRFPLEGPDEVETLLPWLRKTFEYVQLTPPKGRKH